MATVLFDRHESQILEPTRSLIEDALEDAFAEYRAANERWVAKHSEFNDPEFVDSIGWAFQFRRNGGEARTLWCERGAVMLPATVACFSEGSLAAGPCELKAHSGHRVDRIRRWPPVHTRSTSATLSAASFPNELARPFVSRAVPTRNDVTFKLSNSSGSRLLTATPSSIPGSKHSLDN